MQTNFLLGELKITEPAKLVLKRIPFDLVCRHAINEHGNVSKREAEANRMSMHTMGPLTSRYKADPTDPRSPNVVITTAATWCETIIQLE